ncbi:MAG: response regulator [Alphaproteobacteria bacterium]|jgi:two-component system chemotaxis response regulator CheY|nr:response regulator [Alphaproteobacteria bacterium]
MALDRELPILIVDDDKTRLRIVRNLLKQLDFDSVDEAIDGRTALERLKRGTYRLIIAHWNMRPMTGLELLRTVRADAALGATPFIMINGATRTETVVTAKGAGVDNYIVQPFNAATLEAKIAGVLTG